MDCISTEDKQESAECKVILIGTHTHCVVVNGRTSVFYQGPELSWKILKEITKVIHTKYVLSDGRLHGPCLLETITENGSPVITMVPGDFQTCQIINSLCGSIAPSGHMLAVDGKRTLWSDLRVAPTKARACACVHIFILWAMGAIHGLDVGQIVCGVDSAHQLSYNTACGNFRSVLSQQPLFVKYTGTADALMTAAVLHWDTHIKAHIEASLRKARFGSINAFAFNRSYRNKVTSRLQILTKKANMSHVFYNN